jgi:hypothetical protein
MQHRSPIVPTSLFSGLVMTAKTISLPPLRIALCWLIP